MSEPLTLIDDAYPLTVTLTFRQWVTLLAQLHRPAPAEDVAAMVQAISDQTAPQLNPQPRSPHHTTPQPPQIQEAAAQPPTDPGEARVLH